MHMPTDSLANGFLRSPSRIDLGAFRTNGMVTPTADQREERGTIKAGSLL